MEYIPVLIILLTLIIVYALFYDLICDLCYPNSKKYVNKNINKNVKYVKNIKRVGNDKYTKNVEHYGSIIDVGTETVPGTNNSPNMLVYSKIDRLSGWTYVLLGIDFDGNVNIFDREREMNIRFKIDVDFMNWIRDEMEELEFIEIKHNSGDFDVSNVSLLENNIGITGNMDDMPGKVIKTMYYNDGRYSNTVTDHIVLPNGIELFTDDLLRKLKTVAYNPVYSQFRNNSPPPIVSEY